MNKEEYEYHRECVGGLRLAAITAIAFSITFVLTIISVWNCDTSKVYQTDELRTGAGCGE
jgi:hypothetical protein